MQRTPPGVTTRSRETSATRNPENVQSEVGPSNVGENAEDLPLVMIERLDHPPNDAKTVYREPWRETPDAEERERGKVTDRERYAADMDEMIRQIQTLTQQLEAMRARESVEPEREVARDGIYAREERPMRGAEIHLGAPDYFDDRQAYGGENRGQELVSFRARLPRGGWIKNPFENLEFKGKSDKCNPIRFLHKFKRIAAYKRVSSEEQAFHFGRCMKGAVAQWYELQTAETMEELALNFTNYFWGCQAQTRFRQKMYFGRYRASEISMTEYALNLARQAKTLIPPMPDQEIIQTIREHFDADIARELRPSVVRTVEEMVTMLDTIENERETRRQRADARRGTGSTSDASKRTRNDGDVSRKDAHKTQQDGRANQFHAHVRSTRERGQNITSGWNDAKSSLRTPRDTLDIVELPNSDDADGKPKTTSYARQGGTYRPLDKTRDRQRSESKDEKREYSRSRKVAAITAAPQDDGDISSDSDDSELGIKEKELNAITVE